MISKWCIFPIAFICAALLWYKLQTHNDNAADNQPIDNNYLKKDSLTLELPSSLSNESGAETPTVATANSDPIKQQTSLITLSQLNTWVYQGNESDKWRAMSYLLEFDHASVPLLLNLILGDNELALKEQAIMLLSDINPILLSSLKENLRADDQLTPIISVLDIDDQLSNLTDYRIGLSDLENNITTSLITSMMTDNDTQKVSAIKRVSWANFTDSRAVLDRVILHDKSSSVRLAAIEAGLTFDSEHQQEWLKKGLHDIDPEVQTFALHQIQSSGVNIDVFMTDFIGILYSGSDNKASDMVIDLLRYDSSPLALEILTRKKSNQPWRSSNR
ncbi:MAG: hypothetical protein ACI88A_004027 [Paraglaciecola sp.]|jgi:hypothetical protein